jgi:hypothetical protein
MKHGFHAFTANLVGKYVGLDQMIKGRAGENKMEIAVTRLFI